MKRQNRQPLVVAGGTLSALLLAALLTAAAFTTAQGETEDTPQLALVPFVTDLDSPVFMVQADDGRYFIVERAGRIRIFQNGALLDEPFLDISAQVNDAGECGLLSMALAPDYAESGLFYVYYSALADLASPTIEGEPNDGCDTVVARFSVGADANVADPATEEDVVVVNQPYLNHNGGQITFGPDGYLYIALGDGGSGGDPHNLAQNPASLLGKMLRVEVTATGTYTIPADNPYIGDPAYQGEIWALGLRNPWRYSFDRETGDLFIGDVGQGSYEEIDFQAASSTGGENYGWNIREGDHCFGTPPCQSAGLVPPILEYDHTLGWSVVGGYRYRGGAYPNLAGIYLYADYGSGRVWGATEGASGWESQLLLENSQAGTIVSFSEDTDGNLYLIDMNGAIYRIIDMAAYTKHLYLPALINSE